MPMERQCFTVQYPQISHTSDIVTMYHKDRKDYTCLTQNYYNVPYRPVSLQITYDSDRKAW